LLCCLFNPTRLNAQNLISNSIIADNCVFNIHLKLAVGAMTQTRARHLYVAYCSMHQFTKYRVCVGYTMNVPKFECSHILAKLWSCVNRDDVLFLLARHRFKNNFAIISFVTFSSQNSISVQNAGLLNLSSSTNCTQQKTGQ